MSVGVIPPLHPTHQEQAENEPERRRCSGEGGRGGGKETVVGAGERLAGRKKREQKEDDKIEGEREELLR